MKTADKSTKKKGKTLDELEDKYFGKRGAPSREEYEIQVKIEAIGELIKQGREQNHLTQSQLAKKLGMDKTYVSKMENNLKTQRVDTLMKVLNALHGQLFIRMPSDKGTREVELV